MTVKELIEQLNRVDNKDREVKVWMPGTRIILESVMMFSSRDPEQHVLIEGNVEEGEV